MSTPKSKFHKKQLKIQQKDQEKINKRFNKIKEKKGTVTSREFGIEYLRQTTLPNGGIIYFLDRNPQRRIVLNDTVKCNNSDVPIKMG